MQDEQRSMAASNHIGRPLESRSKLEAVGNSNVIILILGFVVSLVVVAYLLFLWQLSPECGFAGWESGLWKTIALRDGVGPSVTISSAILRLTMALQLGVALPMAAGLFLENATAPLRFVPLVLMLRGCGKGSMPELISYLSHTFRSNLLLNFMIVILLLTTTLSQLASTLLVSDLGQGSFLDNPQRQLIAYGLQPAPNVKEGTVDLQRYQESTDDVQYWTSGPAEYPIFAEYSEPPPQWGPAGMQDTGVNLHAFPPFRASDQRASLHQYDGYSAVFDTRVTCLTPVVNSRLLVDHIYTRIWTTAQLSGSANVDLPPHIRDDQNAPVWDRIMRLTFNCSVSLPGVTFEEQAASDWAITICHLGKGGFTIDSPIKKSNSYSSDQQYLVINATGQGEQWQQAVKAGEVDFTNSNVTNPWTRLSLPTNGQVPLTLSLRFCISGLETVNIPTNMTRSATSPRREEPTVTWDDTLRAYDTSQVTDLYAGGGGSSAAQLDSPRNLSDPSSRGILTLAKRTNWTQDHIETRRFAYSSIVISSV